MVIDDLIFKIGYKKDSLKHINNYIIDEITEIWYNSKGTKEDDFNKIMGLLHANLSVVESIERILTTCQNNVDKKVAEFLKNEIK